MRIWAFFRKNDQIILRLDNRGFISHKKDSIKS